MASNVSEGYQRIGGTRMWGGYAVHNTHTLAEWIEPTAEGWRLFDQYAQRSGLPKAVWIQICVVASEPELGTPTLEQVAAVVAITREHAHPEAVLYITGQPLYEEGHICTFAGEGGPELTDQLAREAAADPNLDLIYPGAFGPLEAEHISADTCHATSSGGNLLGEQALGFWG
jgi:hypothetical protein